MAGQAADVVVSRDEERRFLKGQLRQYNVTRTL